MYVNEKICPLLSLKKGEKVLTPCLGSRCNWFDEVNMECGITTIKDAITSIE